MPEGYTVDKDGMPHILMSKNKEECSINANWPKVIAAEREAANTVNEADADDE